jgi:Ni/Co efflux regulator RcnB
MNTRTLAVAGSIAALSFAAVPVAAVAATGQHDSSRAVHVDRSRDPRGARHVDRSRDRSRSIDLRSFDTSRDR